MSNNVTEKKWWQSATCKGNMSGLNSNAGKRLRTRNNI